MLIGPVVLQTFFKVDPHRRLSADCWMSFAVGPSEDTLAQSPQEPFVYVFVVVVVAGFVSLDPATNLKKVFR